MSDMFVVDNSVVMSWCFEDEKSRYSEAVLDRLSVSTALVPSVWPLEVVNVLLVAERRKRLKPKDSVRFISLLMQLPLEVEHERSEKRMSDLLALGRANHLSSYDASYLDLAMRRDCPIATLDEKLKTAAGKMHVSIFGL